MESNTVQFEELVTIHKPNKDLIPATPENEPFFRAVVSTPAALGGLILGRRLIVGGVALSHFSRAQHIIQLFWHCWGSLCGAAQRATGWILNGIGALLSCRWRRPLCVDQSRACGDCGQQVRQRFNSPHRIAAFSEPFSGPFPPSHPNSFVLSLHPVHHKQWALFYPIFMVAPPPSTIEPCLEMKWLVT